LHRVARILIGCLLVLVVLVATVWACLALWYRLPATEPVRALAAALLSVLGLATAVAIFSRLRFHAGVIFVAAFCAVLVWWSTIRPPQAADWAPDVARQVTGRRQGDLLTLINVRDFEWRSATNFAERWTQRTYDLSKLRTLDLFMSYWAGPEMAHVIMSFGFENDDFLAWSIEVRRRNGGQFSPIADLFKSNPLVIIAADERDVIGLRSNIRREDVQIYRLRTPPETARKLLLEYLVDANALSATPEFYNSISTNCTTTIVKMIRAVGDMIPLDWRLIVNGYLPEYAYERGALDTRLPLAELRARAHIDRRALAAGLSPDFSQLIRVDVPSPGERRTPQ
jgi:Domain of unknown function (DUF4105)